MLEDGKARKAFTTDFKKEKNIHLNDTIVVKLCIQIGDNIIHNRTVMEFQVKS